MNKRGAFNIGIPRTIRMPLIFTLFFAILGIAIKSILASQLVLADFFTKYYFEWFKSFGAFVNATQYASIQDLVLSILKEWYYFLYTGGLISLIWAILSEIIHLELNIGKNKNIYNPDEAKKKEIQTKIDSLLIKGYELVNSNETKKAEEVYNEIRKIYTPENDENKEYYQKIINFYKKLTEKK